MVRTLKMLCFLYSFLEKLLENVLGRTYQASRTGVAPFLCRGGGFRLRGGGKPGAPTLPMTTAFSQPVASDGSFDTMPSHFALSKRYA